MEKPVFGRLIVCLRSTFCASIVGVTSIVAGGGVAGREQGSVEKKGDLGSFRTDGFAVEAIGLGTVVGARIGSCWGESSTRAVAGRAGFG